jgi:7-cyano-7-deazaguanine reductase
MFSDNAQPLETALENGSFPSLETFPCPYDTEKINSGIVRIIFPEFTCVCPKTGYPDFASVNLYYLPDNLCLELKSWKLYLNAFRMIGTFHETVTAHLFSTVTGLLRPRWAMVVGDFLPRGNVDTTVVFETDSPRPRGADVLLSSLAPKCKTLT